MNRTTSPRSGNPAPQTQIDDWLYRRRWTIYLHICRFQQPPKRGCCRLHQPRQRTPVACRTTTHPSFGGIWVHSPYRGPERIARHCPGAETLLHTSDSDTIYCIEYAVYYLLYTIHTYMHVNTKCTHVSIYLSIYLSFYLSIYLYTYIYIYVHIYISTYICTYRMNRATVPRSGNPAPHLWFSARTGVPRSYILYTRYYILYTIYYILCST